MGAKRELQDAISSWNKERILNTMFLNAIQWTFNPPAASHHGPTMMGEADPYGKANSPLHYQRQMLSEEGVQTLCCEQEYILNSHPITTVSED